MNQKAMWRRWKVLGVVLMLLLLAGWILTSMDVDVGVDPSTTSQGDSRTEPSNRDEPITHGSEDAEIPIVSPDPEEQTSYVKLFKEVMGWGKTPIAFYGKVVDEAGRGVSGANIKISINDTSREGTTVYRQETDSTGLFTIQNVSGKHLYIEASKLGYYDGAESYRGFQYAGVGGNFTPDPARPEVFRLHKMGERVRLVSKSGRVELAPDKPVVWLDLFTHRTSATPRTESVGIAVTRVVEANETRLQFTLKVSGGGIQEAFGEFNFIAPPSGYQPEVSIIPEEIGGRGFFVRFANDLFAHMTVNFVPGNPNVRLQTKINPDGSRNLESDPNRWYFVRTHRDGSITLIPQQFEPVDDTD